MESEKDSNARKKSKKEYANKTLLYDNGFCGVYFRGDYVELNYDDDDDDDERRTLHISLWWM